MKQLVLIIVTFIYCSSFSQVEKVQQLMNEWKGDASLQYASWSFTLLDVSSGETIVSFDPVRALPPASGMKAITTLAALNLLGPKYTWKTTLETYSKIVSDSIINGDLIIRGTGDPTLGSSRISTNLRVDSLVDQWANELWSAGIRQIKGEIVADQSYFDEYPIPRSWNYDDIGQYYGAGSYGLNCYENTYTLFYSSTATETHIDSVFPIGRGWDFTNDVEVAGRYDNAYIFSSPGCNSFQVTGTIPANKKAFEVDGSVPDPSAVLIDYLERALNKKGIRILREKTDTSDTMGARNIIYTHKSPTLDSVIWHTNRKSVNVYAETLVKTIGREIRGEGSYQAGVKAIRNWLQNTGIEMGGLNIEDGSGLSRLNNVSSTTMAQLMRYAVNSKYSDIYVESLSISGVDGTLKSVTRNSIAEGRILAKSGSMQKVRSYTGLVNSVSGKQYAFSIIVNQYGESSAAIRSRLEDLMIAIAGM